MSHTFRTYERSLILTFDDRTEMEFFMENLQEQLRFVEFLIAGVPKRLKITLRGEKEVVKQACRILKWLQRSISGITHADSFGRFRWDIHYFNRLISGISPDLVLEALKLQGYDLEVHEEYFLSNADFDTVLDLAHSIRYIWAELSQKIRSQALKRVITLVSIIQNEDPTQIYQIGTERGLISENKNRLTLNPDDALKTLLEVVRSSTREM
jgi:hypothetical protein